MRTFTCVFLIVVIEAKKRIAPENNRQSAPAGPSFSARNVDVYSQDSLGPVPFGHILKEGFGDPTLGLKAPIRFLELIRRAPKDRIEATEMLKQTKPEDIQLLVSSSSNFVNPRDKLLRDLGVLDAHPVVNETKLKWYDLLAIQLQNVVNPPTPRSRTLLPRIEAEHGPNREIGQPEKVLAQLKSRQQFMGDRFGPNSRLPGYKQNLTTCDEFTSKVHFYPKDIIGLDWVPFYIWSREDYSIAVVHRFSYPTKKLVNRYREQYSKFYDSIDWEQPKMLLNGYSEFILIAESRYGLFHALSLRDIPPNAEDISLPYAKLRLKIVEPYLVMMFCDDLFATVMAIAGNEPLTEREKHIEAATINFSGKGGPVSRDLAEEERQIKTKKVVELEIHERGTIHIHEAIPSLY